MSPCDIEDAQRLLWRRIPDWMGRSKTGPDYVPSLTPTTHIGNTTLKPSQLAVVAMDIMVYLYLTVGAFGARAQFIEVCTGVMMYVCERVS